MRAAAEELPRPMFLKKKTKKKKLCTDKYHTVPEVGEKKSVLINIHLHLSPGAKLAQRASIFSHYSEAMPL